MFDKTKELIKTHVPLDERGSWSRTLAEIRQCPEAEKPRPFNQDVD